MHTGVVAHLTGTLCFSRSLLCSQLHSGPSPTTGGMHASIVAEPTATPLKTARLN